MSNLLSVIAIAVLTFDLFNTQLKRWRTSVRPPMRMVCLMICWLFRLAAALMGGKLIALLTDATTIIAWRIWPITQLVVLAMSIGYSYCVFSTTEEKIRRSLA